MLELVKSPDSRSQCPHGLEPEDCSECWEQEENNTDELRPWWDERLSDWAWDDLPNDWEDDDE